MMLWQLGACIEGWNRVHGGGEKPDPISNEEFEAELDRAGYG